MSTNVCAYCKQVASRFLLETDGTPGVRKVPICEACSRASTFTEEYGEDNDRRRDEEALARRIRSLGALTTETLN